MIASAPGRAEPLRVLVSTGIFPNRSDGNRGVYVFKQAQALSRRCEVRAIAPVPYAPRWLSFGAYARLREVPRKDTYGGIPTRYPRYVVTPRLGRSLHGWMLYFSTRAAYRSVIREFRPDVVLSFFAFPYGFASVLHARDAGIPAVVSCRGSDINRLAQMRFHRRWIAGSLRRCARVLAVSRALAGEIEALGVPAERIRVVPNGIETDHFRGVSRDSARASLGIDGRGGVVVCVSRLSPEKGIDLLLQAFARARTESLRLFVVGDGAQKRELDALHSRLGLGQRVQFAGARPHDEIPLWMSAADVVVLSSRTEGHPNVVLEALACGRPVVATAVGGVPEILTSDALGLVTPAGDVDALARGIDAAVARTWDEETLKAAARARTWDRVADDLLSLLGETLGATA